LKLFISTLALAAALSGHAQFRRPGVRLLLPNIGLYSGNHPELINYLKGYGVPTTNFKYGGDLFSITHQSESNVIVGVGVGGIYTANSNDYFDVGYADFLLGTPILTLDRFQISLLGHATVMCYTLRSIVPPNVAIPPSSMYFMRGFAYGGGACLRIQYVMGHADEMAVGLGLEAGITFIDPNASWQFGYTVPTTNGRAHFVGVSVPGPKVDPMILFLRFSIVLLGGRGTHEVRFHYDQYF